MPVNQSDNVNEILVVREHQGRRYLLWISYAPGDSGNAVGHIYETPTTRHTGAPRALLHSNDTIRALWVSPSGSIWVASSDGNVATTAPVQWSAPRHAWVDYQSPVPAVRWNVTSLPLARPQGLPPSITALWGNSDEDVHAGTYGGQLYHWDGAAWTQVYDGIGNGDGSINAIGGSGPSNVFAVGSNGTILHYDGHSWRAIQPPGVPDRLEGFTGVHVTSDGEVFITGAGPGPVGRILQGAAAGLAELTRCDVAPRGIGVVAGRMFFPAGAKGVAELVGNRVDVVKGTFDAVATMAGEGRLYFIEAVQAVPSFIEFDPREATPWARIAY